MYKSFFIAVVTTVGSSFLFALHAVTALESKVEIVNSNAGQIRTTHCKSYDGKVYVSGLVARPSNSGRGAHVDVRLISPNGRTILVKSSNVTITGKPATNKTFPYAISFDPEDFAKADHAQVSFFGYSHASCKE